MSYSDAYMKKLEIEKKKKEYNGKKISLKRNNKVCKRNHGKPHEFEETKMVINGVTVFLKKWKQFKCKFCGKGKFEFFF